MTAPCSIEGCEVAIQARGLYMNHYGKARRRGLERLPLHYITQTDRESAVGTCAICGPNTPVVALNQSKNGQCANATREARRRYHASNLDERRKYFREYARKSRARIAQSLLDAAGWSCEICGDPLDESSARIDHDHSCCDTSRNSSCGNCDRGILCNGCNSGLGMFRDNTQHLAAAIAYLQLQGDSA